MLQHQQLIDALHISRVSVTSRVLHVVVSLTGTSPFRGRTTDETYLNITQATSASLSAPAWLHVSDYAKDWVSKLLIKDAKKRMAVNDALAHPWLNVSDVSD